MKKKTWFYVAISCVAISILSLFTSIVSYTTYVGIYGGGIRKTSYSIIDLIFKTEFRKEVLAQYTGPVLWKMGGATVSILAIVAVGAILCAIIGLITLRKQRPNRWNFVMTFIGVIGTTFPSFLVILAVVLSKNYFVGTVSCGLSPIITPIAMVICMFAVLRRKNAVAEQARREAEAAGLIWKAGDL